MINSQDEEKEAKLREKKQREKEEKERKEREKREQKEREKAEKAAKAAAAAAAAAAGINGNIYIDIYIPTLYSNASISLTGNEDPNDSKKSDTSGRRVSILIYRRLLDIDKYS